MPILVEQTDTTTTLSLQERCSVDDIAEALPRLRAALESAPALLFDFSSNVSVDTAVVQFLFSAAKSAQRFDSDTHPSFVAILERWGITAYFS
jgi:hypothetical protein